MHQLYTPPRMKWRIYYDDGSTFDNTQGKPEQAPPFGVLCIVAFNKDNGRSIFHKWDFYYYNTTVENWFGCDMFGLLDQLCHDNTNALKAVKQGRTVSNKQFRKILAKAVHDPDFPKQQAHDTLDDREKFIKERTG